MWFRFRKTLVTMYVLQHQILFFLFRLISFLFRLIMAYRRNTVKEVYLGKLNILSKL